MAQAGFPSITIPSAEYTAPVQQELRNTKLEGDGVRIFFLYEAWPQTPSLFNVVGEISTTPGQPVYQPWINSEFPGAVPPKGNGYFKIAMWPGENDGQGGRKVIKGDIRVTLIPHQTFRTTITIEII